MDKWMLVKEHILALGAQNTARLLAAILPLPNISLWDEGQSSLWSHSVQFHAPFSNYSSRKFYRWKIARISWEILTKGNEHEGMNTLKLFIQKTAGGMKTQEKINPQKS